tara:strand:+ start:35402 stop:37867 length:2466 start_codon:yes stop_codon:yes gene_type:complete
MVIQLQKRLFPFFLTSNPKITFTVFFVLLVTTMSTSLFSQTITIKDIETSRPIELVTLMSKNSQIHAITNTEGQADISKFENLENIEIRTLGYKSIILSYEKIVADSFIVFLSKSNLNLDEVVVSATRWWQNSSDIPSKIITISPQKAALYSPQTTADLLGISGNVYIQKSQQGGGSPMIRGFATNRLLYTVDGIRMNTAIFRGGNLQNVINIDPFALEKTEVLFGPGSVIYGSDAIGGVMSFQTLNPQLSLANNPLISGKAVARYSSASNEKTGHFDVNIGWQKWALITSLSSWNFDDLRQGKNGPDDYLKPFYVSRQNGVDQIITQENELIQKPSAYSQINLMQKVRFKPNEDWDFQYAFHFSETSSYGRYDRHNRLRNDTARYAEWDYGPQLWMMNNITLNNFAQTSLYDQATIRLAYQNFEESRIDRSLNDDLRSIRIENVDAYSANIDFSKSTSTRNKVFYGFEYVLNDVNSIGKDEDISTRITVPGPTRYPKSSWHSIAVFVNDEFKFSENFTVQTGIRYNQFILNAVFDTTFYPFPFSETNITNNALTGSIGGVFRPISSLVLSLNFGTAFRSPNVDDMGKIFDSEPGSVVVPNPDLNAEYAYNLDVGVAKVFGDFVKIDLTGYYTILRNALVRRDFQINGLFEIEYDGQFSTVQAIQNASRATVYGIQAGMNLKLPSNFELSSDINFQVGEEELDDGTKSPSRHAAPIFGTTRFSYNASNLILQLYANYQGEKSFEDLAVEEQGKDEIYAKDENRNNYAPSWYTLNLKTMYQFNEDYTLSAGIENLTDQRYRPYSSGLSGPGRNFFVSVKASI